MRPIGPMQWLSGFALWLFGLATVNALAAEKSPFYQGKTLNIVINFAAGGPTDIESRIFAKHLPRPIARMAIDHLAR